MNSKIQMNRIQCIPDRTYNKADDMHLRASIQNRIANGLKPLLQPIALKALVSNSDYDYIVEDGRRRFMALTDLKITEIELGQEAILIDGDSEINAYLANQHTNLSLAEEISKLFTLRERFKTLDALAAEIGHSPAWVARRLNLLNLSELWKKAMEAKTFGYMSIAHYETIATFPPEIQNDIFNFIRSIEGKELKNASVRKFSETLYDKFATLLSSLPWKEEGCGECPACRERKESSYLFYNMMPEPKCMNREYLEKRRKEYVASLAAQEPETILVSQKYRTQEEKENSNTDDPLAENTVLGPGDWQETQDPTEGVPAIIADGPRAGTKITIQRPQASTESTEKKSKTLAERKEAKNRQRKRKAIEKLLAAIKAEKTLVPNRTTIYLMIACKGTKAACGEHFDYKTKKSSNTLGLPDKIMSFTSLDNKDETANKELDTLLWKHVCENIFAELTLGQNGPNEPCWVEAALIAGLVNFDLDKAFEEATKELPDPKAWETLAKAEEKAAKGNIEEAA